jgi:hypothetical protein
LADPLCVGSQKKKEVTDADLFVIDLSPDGSGDLFGGPGEQFHDERGLVGRLMLEHEDRDAWGHLGVWWDPFAFRANFL